MFRTTIRADEKTDVATAVARLRREAERAGVPVSDVMTLTELVRATMENLVGRGRDMAGVSTVVSAEKTFKDTTYEVRLTFGAGGERSLLQRFAEIFRRR